MKNCCLDVPAKARRAARSPLLPWLLLASLVGLGCSTERDPPSYSPITGETITSDKETEHFEGDPLPPDMQWQGYLPGSSEVSTITLGEFHDPDGSKGIGALLFTEISTTCGACQQTAADLPAKLAGNWGTWGVEVFHLVFMGPDELDALTKQWKDTYEATWVVASDPNITFLEAGSNAVPIHVIVDPRTLQIVSRSEGYRSDLPALDKLASSNQ